MREKERQLVSAFVMLLNLVSITVTVFTLSLGWNHFIAPVFNVPEIGIILSFVIILMYELLTFKSSDLSIPEILGHVSGREEKEIELEYAVVNVGVSIFTAVVLFILSFII